MLLNYSTSINTIVGKVESNETQIMLYGHVNERYNERLKRIQEVTKMKELKLDKLINKTVKLIKDNYEECINKDHKKVRHVIRGEIHLNCEGRHFVIDVSLLVTGTVIDWYHDKPKVVDNQYKDLYENGILNLYDNILSIETLSTTIRFHNEETMNFSEQPEVANLNLPKKIYNVTRKDIVYMTKHMVEDKYNKISKHAWKIIKTYTK